MIESVCFLFITTAEPTPFAACSREMRCRSTSTCFSSALKSCENTECDSAISGSASTAGFTHSNTPMRSGFFAQPGKGKLRRLRAIRTRLLTTI